MERYTMKIYSLPKLIGKFKQFLSKSLWNFMDCNKLILKFIRKRKFARIATKKKKS